MFKTTNWKTETGLTALQEGKAVVEEAGGNPTFPSTRLNRRKRQYYEISGNGTPSDPEQHLRIVFFNPLVDNMLMQLQEQFSNIPKIMDSFKFLQYLREESSSDENFEQAAKDFQISSKDIGPEITDEIKTL